MPGSEDMDDTAATMGPATQEMVKHVKGYTDSKVKVALDQRQADWDREREDLRNTIQKLQDELKGESATTSRTTSLGSSLSGSPSKQAGPSVSTSITAKKAEKKLQKEIEQLRFENTRLKRKYDGVVSALEKNVAKHESERSTWRRCKKAMHRVIDQNPSVGDAFIRAEKELDEEEEKILSTKIRSGKSRGKKSIEELPVELEDLVSDGRTSSGRTTPTKQQNQTVGNKEHKATLPGTRKPLRTPTKRSTASASRANSTTTSNSIRSSDLSSNSRPSAVNTTPQKTARSNGPLSSIPWANPPQAPLLPQGAQNGNVQRTPPTVRRGTEKPAPPAPYSNASELHLANIAYAEQEAEDDLPASARKQRGREGTAGSRDGDEEHEAEVVAMMEAELQREQEELDNMVHAYNPSSPFRLSPLRTHPPRSTTSRNSRTMSQQSSVDVRVREAQAEDERYLYEEKLRDFEEEMAVEHSKRATTQQPPSSQFSYAERVRQAEMQSFGEEEEEELKEEEMVVEGLAARHLENEDQEMLDYPVSDLDGYRPVSPVARVPRPQVPSSQAPPAQASTGMPASKSIETNSASTSGVAYLFPLPKEAYYNPPSELEIIDESLPRFKQLNKSLPTQSSKNVPFKQISDLAASARARMQSDTAGKQAPTFKAPPPPVAAPTPGRQRASSEARSKAMNMLDRQSQIRQSTAERKRFLESQSRASQHETRTVYKSPRVLHDDVHMQEDDEEAEAGEAELELEQREKRASTSDDGRQVEEQAAEEEEEDEAEQGPEEKQPEAWKGFVSRASQARTSSSPQKDAARPSPFKQAKTIPEAEDDYDDSATEASSKPSSSAPSAAVSPDRKQHTAIHISSATVQGDPVTSQGTLRAALLEQMSSSSRPPINTAVPARKSSPADPTSLEEDETRENGSAFQMPRDFHHDIVVSHQPSMRRTQTSSAAIRISTYGKSRVFNSDTDAPPKLLSEAKLPPRKKKQQPECVGSSARLPPVPSLPLEMCAIAPMIEELRASSSAKPADPASISTTPHNQARNASGRSASVEPALASGTPLWVHPTNKKRKERHRLASQSLDNVTPGSGSGNAPDSGVAMTRNKSAMPRGKVGTASVVKRVAELQGREIDSIKKDKVERQAEPEEDSEIPLPPMRAFSLPKKAGPSGDAGLDGAGGSQRQMETDDPFVETSRHPTQSKQKQESSKQKYDKAPAKHSGRSTATNSSSSTIARELIPGKAADQSAARSAPVLASSEKTSVPTASTSKTAGKKRKGRNGVPLPDDIEDDLSAVGRVILNARGTPAGRYFSYDDNDRATRSIGNSGTDTGGQKKQLNVDQALRQAERKRQRESAGVSRAGSCTQLSHKRKHDIGGAEAVAGPSGTSAHPSAKRSKQEHRESGENTPIQARKVEDEKERDYSEAHEGQDYLRAIHKRRKEELKADPFKYKNGGMYAQQLAGALAAKNLARIEVNPDLNNGVGHAYQEVVRNKDARKQLHGIDCDCCKGYYESRVRHLPLEQRVDAANKIIEDSSRHRQQWEAPPTPPGYWQMGFPDSQQVEKIKKKADKMEEEKRAKMEAEANRCDGRFRYKPN